MWRRGGLAWRGAAALTGSGGEKGACMLDILVDVLLDALGEIKWRPSRRKKESGERQGKVARTDSSSQAVPAARKNTGAPRSASRPTRAKRRRRARGQDAVEVLRVGR